MIHALLALVLGGALSLEPPELAVPSWLSAPAEFFAVGLACEVGIEQTARYRDSKQDVPEAKAVCFAIGRSALREGVPLLPAIGQGYHEGRFRWEPGHSGAHEIGPLQVIPWWRCPGRKAWGCDPIGAAHRSLVRSRERRGDWTWAFAMYNPHCGRYTDEKTGERRCESLPNWGYARVVQRMADPVWLKLYDLKLDWYPRPLMGE